MKYFRKEVDKKIDEFSHSNEKFLPSNVCHLSKEANRLLPSPTRLLGNNIEN